MPRNRLLMKARPLTNRDMEPEEEVLQALGLDSLIVCFQPILSFKSKAVAGYEGLIRGIRETDGEIVPPPVLFETARSKDLMVETDRLCRATALEAFRFLSAEGRGDRLLFLNFDSSLLNTVEAGNGYLLRQVAEAGLSPSRVVLELIESKVDNPVSLKKFVDFYRVRGFIIALDDVGAGYSNFDRIPQIRPDIIKVDRSIITGIEKDYCQQEVFRSLKNLSRKIGALVLAEGVETEEEALCGMELDADFVQGYFFAKPQLFCEDIDKLPQDTATRLRALFRGKRVKEVEDTRKLYLRYDEIASHVWERLRNKKPAQFDATLTELIDGYSEIEAMYVLNIKGIQVTDTILSTAVSPRTNSIFRCADKGDDLSLKQYFYLLVDTGLRKYTTDSYISLATGSVIRTITTIFTAADNGAYVLCLDISDQD